MAASTEQAVQDVLSAEAPSIRSAARKWEAPLSTVSHRLNGRVSRREGHTNQQNLTPAQEEWLVKWILEQEQLGHAPTHQCVREFASKIRDASGEDPRIGKNWLGRFIQRNPIIHTKIGRKIDH